MDSAHNIATLAKREKAEKPEVFRRPSRQHLTFCIVPEGPVKIAQHFNAGLRRKSGPSPEGTAEIIYDEAGASKLKRPAPLIQTLDHRLQLLQREQGF